MVSGDKWVVRSESRGLVLTTCETALALALTLTLTLTLTPPYTLTLTLSLTLTLTRPYTLTLTLSLTLTCETAVARQREVEPYRSAR